MKLIQRCLWTSLHVKVLIFKRSESERISSECTVYRNMEEIGFSHCLQCKPNGITKADQEIHNPMVCQKGFLNLWN